MHTGIVPQLTPGAEPDGDSWRVTGVPAEYAPLLALLRAAVRGDDGVLSAIQEGADIVHPEWSVAVAGDVTPDVRKAWVDYLEWEEDDGPLALCRVTADDESLIVERVFLQDLVYDVRRPIEVVEQRSAARRHEAELVRWAEGLPRLELSWDNIADDIADELRALEKAAQDLDTKAADSPPEDHAVAAERRQFFMELHRLGIFERGRREQRRATLQSLELAEVVAYHDAGQDLLDYLVCDARRQARPGIPSVPVVVSPVSIDWFRLGPWIGGIADTMTWTAWAEAELFEREDPTGSGWIYWSSGSVSETFLFREDNDKRAALVKVGRPVPGARAVATEFECDGDSGPQLEAAAIDIDEYAESEPGALGLVIAMLTARLQQAPSAANAWYRLGLALLRLSQNEDDDRIRALARRATARALLLSPQHELARGIWNIFETEDSPREADAMDSGQLAGMGAVVGGKKALVSSVVRLPANLRDEAIMALANQEHELGAPVLRWVLEARSHPLGRPEDLPSLFLQRYVLKRLARSPVSHSFVGALKKLASSKHAPLLRPHLQWAEIAIGSAPKKPWWKLWS